MSGISVESRLEIYELIARYSHAVDNYRGEAWADLFLENGKLSSPVSTYLGHQALINQAKSLCDRGVKYRHVITNIYLTDDSNEETAEAHAYGTVGEWSKVPATIGIFVEYRFNVAKHEGRWKIAEASVEMPYNADLLAGQSSN